MNMANVEIPQLTQTGYYDVTKPKTEQIKQATY